MRAVHEPSAKRVRGGAACDVPTTVPENLAEWLTYDKKSGLVDSEGRESVATVVVPEGMVKMLLNHPFTKGNTTPTDGTDAKETLAVLFGRRHACGATGRYVVEYAVFPPQTASPGSVTVTDCALADAQTQYFDLLLRVLPPAATEDLVLIGTWHTHPNDCAHCPTALDWHMFFAGDDYPAWRVDFVAIMNSDGELRLCDPWRITKKGRSAIRGCNGYYARTDATATSRQHACALNNPRYNDVDAMADGCVVSGKDLVQWDKGCSMRVLDFTGFGSVDSPVAVPIGARATALEILALDGAFTLQMACTVTCAREHVLLRSVIAVL